MSVLREIIAKFGIHVDAKALEKGHEKIDEFVETLKGAGEVFVTAFAAEKVKEFVFGLTEQADALNKHADSLGMSLQELQQWTYAASLADVSADALAGTLARLPARLVSKDAASAMGELGVKMRDAAGALRPTQDLIEDIADGLSTMPNATKRNELAMRILGRSYLELMPLLKDGGKGIREAREEFEELGGGFDPEFARRSEEVNDNMTRLEFIWKQFQISVLSRVLPAIISLEKRFISWGKILGPIIKNSSILEALAVTLGLKGILFLSEKVGSLGDAFKLLGKRVAPIVVAFLLLEDVITFLRGGDSLTGRLIDKLFGKGASEDVRNWVSNVKKEFFGFIDDLKKQPQKLIEDWDLFTVTVEKDIRKTFGPVFGEVLNTALKMFFTFVDILTGGWSNAGNKLKAIIMLVGLTASMVVDELLVAAEHLGAMFYDLLTDLWNGLMKILGFTTKVAGFFPNLVTGGKFNQLADFLAKAGTVAPQDYAGKVERMRDQMRTNYAHDYDVYSAQLNAPAYAPQLTSNVYVTVPPGTPAEQARAVGQAAKKGTTEGLNRRATKAALVPGG